MRIIDNHIHCGNNIHKSFTPDDIRQDLKESGACGAVIFAFPEDMYRIEDSKEWRIKANDYILNVSKDTKDITLYPFYFVWNDYLIPSNLENYAGIKWHRHWDEPRYNYKDPKCDEILTIIKTLDLPVLIEEEFENTVQFVKDNPELKIIIPHIGNLNGGYDKMDAFFQNGKVYFDTSCATLEAIKRVLDNVGPERILFGSDVSGTRTPFFNYTKVELEKVSQLELDEKARAMIFFENIESLIPKKFL